MKHLLNFKEDFPSKHDNTITIIAPSLYAILLQPGIGPLQSCQPCLNTTALGLIKKAFTVQVCIKWNLMCLNLSKNHKEKFQFLIFLLLWCWNEFNNIKYLILSVKEILIWENTGWSVSARFWYSLSCCYADCARTRLCVAAVRPTTSCLKG